MDFEKITKEAVVQALLEIKKNGIPKNAHSSTYDILYKGKRYPPKLVMEYAYQHSTGKQITRNDFEGGEKTPCFNRLKELGFTIVHKEKNPNFYETLTKFLEQTKTKSQKYKDYPKEFLGLNISVSFGIGGPSKTPWISFLYDGQKTQHGIYPVYLYYKEYNTLFLAYGVSETTPPNIEWKFNTSPETIFDFFKRKGIKPKRYGNSYVFKDYDINNLNPSTINKDLFEIIENYKNLMASYTELIWECPTYQILEQTFTHKETMLTFNQPGSVLLVPIAKSRSYFKDFNERSKVIHYYFGKIKMGGVYEHLNFQKYDYFIPVIEGKIRDVYRIEYASVRHRNDIPGIEPKENVDLSDFRIYMKLTSPSYLTGAKRLIPIRHSRIDYKCFFKEYNSITEVINLITE